MEFSYKVSEKDFMEAYRLCVWKLWRKLLVGCFLAAALVELLVLLVQVREGLAFREGLIHILGADPANTNLILLVMLLLGPSIAVFLPRWRVLHTFRKGPLRDATVHALVTPEHLDVKLGDTGGSNFKWDFYKNWREGKNVIVLVTRTSQSQFLSKASLTEAQLDELRSILNAALPKK